MKILSLITVVILCAKLHLISAKTVEDFVLIGKEKKLPYKQFAGLPTGSCSTLKTLHLEYVQFEPNALILSLTGCNELRNITLTSVEIIGTIGSKVVLPNMETFSLTMHNIVARSADEFMAHIFFNKTSTDEVIPSNLNILIESYMDGNSLEYDSRIRRLELRYIKYDVAKYFDYNELKLHLCYLDPQTLKTANLTSLELSNDFYKEEDFNVLKSAERLNHLRIYQERWDGTFQDLSFDLSILPTISKFQTLILHRARVGSTKPINLEKLGYLSLFQCDMNMSLISISQSVYRLYLENVTFNGNNLNSFMSRMNNLTYVTLEYTTHPNQEFDIASLADSRHTLKDFNLYGLKVQLSSSDFEFQVLESMVFIECEFHEKVDTGNSSIFLSVTELIIEECKITYAQFQQLLTPSVNRVVFGRNDIDPPQIDQFLLDSGVPPSVKNPKFERSNDTTTGWSYIRNQSKLQNTVLRNTVLYTYVLVLLVICVVGVFGNILSGIVLTRKSMRSSTSCILLGLTMCDCIVLTTYACSLLYFGIKLILVFLNFAISTDHQTYYIFGFEVGEFSVGWLDKFQYRLLYPLNKTAYTGSVYATVLLTLERYVAVCWPFYVRRLLQLKTVIYSTIFVLCFAVILNFPRWIEAQQYSSQIYLHVPNSEDDSAYRAITLHFARNTYGSGLLRNRFYRQYYHGLLWVTVMYVLPISGLSFFNFKIWSQLKQSKLNRGSMTSTSIRQDRDDKEMASLTRMLLCVIMIFVICNCMSGIIVWTLIWYGGWDPSDIEVFSCIPLIINSSINFVIYTLLGTKFRRELRKLISRWLRLICRIESRTPESQSGIRMTTITSTT